MKFISQNNIDYIQDYLKDYFLKTMNVNIQDQSHIEMKIIMNSIKTNYGTNIESKEELIKLNNILLKELISQVKLGIEQHKGYLKYINNPIEPIPVGINTRTDDISLNTSRLL